MRLIDANYLKKVLNIGSGEKVEINISKSMTIGEIVDTVIHAYRKCLFAELEKMPTAYDVDKVVERLEETREEMLSETEYENDTVNHYFLKYTDLMIETVKSGGSDKRYMTVHKEASGGGRL